MTPRRLRLVSLLAPASDRFYEALADHLCDHDLNLDIDSSLPWDARRALIGGGEPIVFALCPGLYVRSAASRGLRALASLVPSGDRYRGEPIFYADVIVRRSGSARSFADLRGASFAVNDDESLSGHDAVLDRLLAMGVGDGFFGDVVASGSHARSIELVRTQRVESAAIDSLVLDAALEKDPSLEADLRVVASLGPFPSHGFAASSQVERAEAQKLTHALTSMHMTSEGRRVLATGALDRCIERDLTAYQPIRALVDRAANLNLKNRRAMSRASSMET